MLEWNRNGGIARVNGLLDEILPSNRFYQQRLKVSGPCRSAEDFLAVPMLMKKELVADALAHPPYGTNLTYPLERYVRYHQTSGTTGTPLRVLDTAETWDWWGRCWVEVLRSAGVTAKDRLFFAFSFAPSIGFWSAYHGASMLGCLCIPAGGTSSSQRLRMILDTGATVLLCTPSYALHLAEVSRREGINLRDLQVRITIHAGEPGASIPGTRARIQETWNALVIDHAGATEVGAYGLGCLRGRGVHVNEEEFIAEVVRPGTCEPAAEGELGELVITNLGRGAWPVIRYRTGDLVRARRGLCECGSSYLLLDGGIVGRADEMITVRGMNVFPSALEDVIRSVADLAEYRIIVTKNGEMDELVVELEASRPQCNQVSQTIRHQMGIRVNVRPAAPGSLSCSDGKAGRIVDLRHAR